MTTLKAAFCWGKAALIALQGIQFFFTFSMASLALALAVGKASICAFAPWRAATVGHLF
jgi:hypothetical protein